MADLKEREIEEAEFVFQVYANDGLLDCTELGTVLRSLQLNPSLETLEKFGATKKIGEKKIKFEELLPIYSQLKKEVKDQGCYEDFIECLKLYDKAEDGKMLYGELHHALMSLGERLTDVQVDEVFDDCLGEEDDEGQIEYTRKFTSKLKDFWTCPDQYRPVEATKIPLSCSCNEYRSQSYVLCFHNDNALFFCVTLHF